MKKFLKLFCIVRFYACNISPVSFLFNDFQLLHCLHICGEYFVIDTLR